MRFIGSVDVVSFEGLPVGIVRFTERMEVLSSAVLNGGDSTMTAAFIMQVPRNYNERDPISHAIRVRDALGLPEDSIGMMTAAEVDYVFNVQEREYDGITACAIATAGLSNHVVAGDVLVGWDKRHVKSMERARVMMAGTINVMAVSPVPLTMEGKVNMTIPLTEAKSAAMSDLGFRETGTTSDSIAVISPIGDDRESYAGTGSSLGIAVARAARAAVGTSLRIRGEHPVPEEPMDVLSGMGYTAESMMEMSGSGSDPDAYRRMLDDYLSDPRVRTLLDLAIYISYRADSLSDDGNIDVRNIMEDVCRQIFGSVPNGFEGTVDAMVRAMAEHVGRCVDG